jgi:hypothetical protein
VSAGATGYSHNQHSGFFPQELDAFRFEKVRTETALFLLEVFLDGLEASTMQVAHTRPPILGSTKRTKVTSDKKPDLNLDGSQSVSLVIGIN